MKGHGIFKYGLMVLQFQTIVILFTVNVLYNKAVFYTNAEYENLSGIKIQVQGFIEILELYLLGRWRSNDEELGYVDTRTKCLKDFNVRLQAKDIPIADVIRFFHGDGPAMQFEAGNEKGDHYFCPNCDISYIQTDDINHCYQLPITTLSCKQKKSYRWEIWERKLRAK